MAAISVNPDICTQPLSELKRQIVEALQVDYNEEIADAAGKYITNEMETSEELIDDLATDHQESGLVDHIMTSSGIQYSESQNIFKLLIMAVNGEWINEKVTKIGKISFYPEIVEAPKKININCKDNDYEESISYNICTELKEMQQYLVKQWDDSFLSFDQNLDLMKLFVIGKKQNMIHLTALLHEVYSQWRINYLIDCKKKGQQRIDPTISGFVRKSKAFKQLTEKNKKLIVSAVGLYKLFSFQPIITPLFVIKDDIYQFALYSYIMSEAINNLITTNSITLPLQIDFWIIPKKVEDIIMTIKDDEDEEDEEEEAEATDDGDTVLNIEQRLKLDKEIKYEKFTIDLENEEIKKLQTKFENKIKACLAKQKSSHNRLVCIVDRRDKYYDFKILKDEEIETIIQIDINKENTKKCDEIFIYQPTGKYGQFDDDYCQEHLYYLSREYMIPKTTVKHAIYNSFNTAVCGTYNSFNSQMFTLSFCCHSKSNIHLQWFINGWNMRITKLENLTKVWPEFFEKTEKNMQNIQKIQENIIRNWKLSIINKEYEIYEKDLIRFDHDGKRNKYINGQCSRGNHKSCKYRHCSECGTEICNSCTLMVFEGENLSLIELNRIYPSWFFKVKCVQCIALRRYQSIFDRSNLFYKSIFHEMKIEMNIIIMITNYVFDKFIKCGNQRDGHCQNEIEIFRELDFKNYKYYSIAKMQQSVFCNSCYKRM